MVERGEFREDLYYRLRGITMEIPALRARLGDLPRLGEHLLARIAAERGEAPKSLAPDAVELLGRHRWPGNVRELENALRVASLFTDGDRITAGNLAENVDDLRSVGAAMASTAGRGAAPRTARLPAPRLAGPPPDILAPVDDDDGDNDDDNDEGPTAPLPSGEASATAIAYAQVHQGAFSLAGIKRQIERDCIARALAETRGNITRAASILGMKRPASRSSSSNTALSPSRRRVREQDFVRSDGHRRGPGFRLRVRGRSHGPAPVRER